MTTASTRSTRRRRSRTERTEGRRGAEGTGRGKDTQGAETAPRPQPAEPAQPAGPPAGAVHPADSLPERLFLALALAILAVAAALRLFDLPLVPFHHDEGINGLFVADLVRRGTWHYDPANYHGPTLFYFAFAAQYVLGLTDQAMRVVPAIFGLGTLGLVLALRPFIGPAAALSGAAMLAVSPGATYFSRYFIHESLVVFFTLAIVVGGLWYLRDGRVRLLLLTAVAIALLLATKETGFVTLVVLAIALAMALGYVRLRAGRVMAQPSAARPSRAPRASHLPRSSSSSRPDARQAWLRRFPAHRLAAAAVLGLTVYVLFFSSFLTNLQGVPDSLAALAVWTQTGGETQVQPLQQYLVWMLRGDALILAAGLIGGLIAAGRGDDHLAVFIGLWALGITAAYSLISYKVPWLALNMLVPLAILGGLAVRELVERVRSVRLRAVGAVAAVAGLAFTAYQSVDLNFNRYDDEFAYPYVFVHTTRAGLGLVDETKRIADAAGTGRETGIVVTSAEYWPLPWYYRDYPRVGYYGAIIETDEPLIVANVNQEAELAAALGDRYQRRGAYNLRPGVDLVLYVRSDLAGL